MKFFDGFLMFDASEVVRIQGATFLSLLQYLKCQKFLSMWRIRRHPLFRLLPIRRRTAVSCLYYVPQMRWDIPNMDWKPRAEREKYRSFSCFHVSLLPPGFACFSKKNPQRGITFTAIKKISRTPDTKNIKLFMFSFSASFSCSLFHMFFASPTIRLLPLSYTPICD